MVRASYTADVGKGLRLSEICIAGLFGAYVPKVRILKMFMKKAIM